jgi:hypothetical protein
MSAVTIPEGATEVAILGRVITTQGLPLSPEAARSILDLSFGPADVDRMQELAEKAREGTLTEAERVEIDNYERAGHVISLHNCPAISRTGSTG